MKTLIMLSAMPGSGKSTWAKAYREAHPHTLIVSSDEIRYELTGTTQDFSKQKEVWELFSLRIHEYAKKYDDVTVILDALTDLNVLRESTLKRILNSMNMFWFYFHALLNRFVSITNKEKKLQLCLMNNLRF